MTPNQSAAMLALAEYLGNAAKAANEAWTAERSVSISCVPHGFRIAGRLLIRSLREEVRAEQLRTYAQTINANVNVLAFAVERVIHMLDKEAERVLASKEPTP